ncbi:MAG: hypothetical protein AMXMBFR64_05190 [Myxococcales bacterium]
MGMHRILRLGSLGPDVRALQEALALRSHPPGPLDGVYGELTKAAVSAFQAAGKIKVDGVVGSETRGALAARPAPAPATPCPPALDDGVLPEGIEGVWIHRLQAAIDLAGDVAHLVADLLARRIGVVQIKAADGRSLMNQARLGEVVTALHAAGIRVVLWSWVWAVYYGKDGRPESPYHASVEYLVDQARVLADQCRRHGCTGAVYANIEGEGTWSTSSAGTWGQRNIATFGSQAKADRAIAQRADAYLQALRAELPGALLVVSTHGLASSQRLPWRELCEGSDVLAPQWYYPGAKGFAERVPTSASAWRKLGARRLRASGGAWKATSSSRPASEMPKLRAAVRSIGAGPGVDRGVDWWVYELMTAEHLAALAGA